MGPQKAENREKYLKVRASVVELVEVKRRAKEAGYDDVSAYIRYLLRERRDIEAFKNALAKEIVLQMKQYGVGLALLRSHGLEE